MTQASDERPSLDRVFMDIARTWATRSTCQHLQVGAVLAKDSRAIASGYNGAPPGIPHCEHSDMHLPYEQWEPCSNTNHAEGNVLAFAARVGAATDGTTLYTTHSPCLACSGLLISAGVRRVVWEQKYRRDNGAGQQLLQRAGVQLLDLSQPIVDGVGVDIHRLCSYGPCFHERRKHYTVFPMEGKDANAVDDAAQLGPGGPCGVPGCDCMRFRK